MYEKRIMFFAGLVLGAMLFIISRVSLADGFPDFLELNELGTIYESVEFDHAMHADITSCADCHHHTLGSDAENEKCLPCHRGSGASRNVTCGSCHPRDPVTAYKRKTVAEPGLYHLDTAGLKRAYHLKCLGCHREMEVPSGCEDCHSKKEAAGDTARAESESNQLETLNFT